MKEFTHKDLVARGARWLRSALRCTIVITEFPSPSGEIPDVMGWKYSRSGRSVMIECKASRSDFFADAKKPWHAENRVGAERYYLAPAGLIGVNEVPEDWGLLQPHGKGVTVVKPARPRKDLRSELGRSYELRMLIQIVNRIQYRVGNVDLNEWMRWENRNTPIEQMQNFTSCTIADPLELMGWEKVIWPQDLPEDPITGEPWCPVHDELFCVCACAKPYLETHDYIQPNGVLYARRKPPAVDAYLTRDGYPLVAPCPSSTM